MWNTKDDILLYIPRMYITSQWLLLILVGLGFSTPLLANSCDRIEDLFHEAYYDKQCYTFGICGYNAKRFLNYLQKEDIPIDETRVVFLLHEKRKTLGPHGPSTPGPLFPNHRRPESVGFTSFAFHFIVEFRGRILDFDYLDHATPIHEYIAKQFARPTRGPQDYHNLDVPARIELVHMSGSRYLELYEIAESRKVIPQDPAPIAKVLKELIGQEFQLTTLKDFAAQFPVENRE